MEQVIEIKNLCKKYKDFQIENVSFNLPKGCIMGFIGANGNGKTTVLRIILNTVIKDSGEVKVFGKDHVTFEEEIKQEVGVLTDDSFLSDYLSAVQIGNVLSSVYLGWDKEYYTELLKKFDIPPKKKLRKLSKGMKMKVQIATTLAHRPKLLILDEPTGGIDPLAREEILEMLQDFISDGERSVLLSTHILSDIEKIADYITLIHGGKILFSKEKDLLQEEYCIVKGAKETLADLAQEYVVSVREHSFGYEALMHKEATVNLNNVLIEKAPVEEIMLFFVRGERQ